MELVRVQYELGGRPSLVDDADGESRILSSLEGKIT